MHKYSHKFILTILLATVTLQAQVPTTKNDGDRASVHSNHSSANTMPSGLFVRLGCRDANSAMETTSLNGWVSLVLGRNEIEVNAARKVLQEAGVYGRISAINLPAKEAGLPFPNNFVNRMVQEEEVASTATEAFRVLAPRGSFTGPSALRKELEQAGFSAITDVENGKVTAVKPWPKDLDEWGHRQHDASGDMVSRDQVIGPLTDLQWQTGPLIQFGLSRKSSNIALLSAGGRNFYVTSLVTDNLALPPADRDNHRWLVARDAFNGLMLWKRPAKGVSYETMVVTADRVYLTPGGKLSMLDPVTGADLPLKESLSGIKQIKVSGKYLLLLRNNLSVHRADTGEEIWKSSVLPDKFVTDENQVYFKSRDKLACLNLADGKEAWQVSVTAGDLYWCKDGVLGLLAATTSSDSAKPPTDGKPEKKEKENKDNDADDDDMSGGTVPNRQLIVHSTKDGAFLWRQEFVHPSTKVNESPVYLADNLVWFVGAGGMANDKRGRSKPTSMIWRGFESATGKLAREVNRPYSKFGCNRSFIATEKFGIEQRPVRFVDWKTGKGDEFMGVRFACGLQGYGGPSGGDTEGMDGLGGGAIVGNGLFYTMPQPCGCLPTAERGFIALSSSPRQRDAEIKPFLVKGPAFGKTQLLAEGDNGWSAWLGNPYRTAETATTLPGQVKELWSSALDKPLSGLLGDEIRLRSDGGDTLTSPVAARGRVFTAAVESHRVLAFDATSGNQLWNFTADGRVDVAPALYRGLCLFASRDGWVYCVTEEKGELVWKARIARDDRRIMVSGQLESPQPVVGGVLVDGGLAFAISGHSPEVGDGAWLHAFDPLTGERKWCKKPHRVPSALISDGTSIVMPSKQTSYYTPEMTARSKEAVSQFSLADGGFKSKGTPVIPRKGNLLDRKFHWGSPILQMTEIKIGSAKGFLLATAKERVISYDLNSSKFKSVKPTDPPPIGILAAYPQTPSDSKSKTKPTALWSREIPPPSQVEALIVAGDTIFAAGPKDVYHREKGGFLMALSVADGSVINELPLAAPISSDGLAADGGRLFVTTHDGKLLAFGTP